MTSLEIFGHRGTNPYPDHTAAADAAAIDWGADWAEFDVQMTKDGVLVVYHDTGSIPTMTYAQVLAMYPTIQTLDQAIDLVQAKEVETGRTIKMSIEVKNPATYAARGLDPAQALVNTLVAQGVSGADTVSISSFDSATVQRVAAQLLPAAGIEAAVDYLGYGMTAATLTSVGQWADSVSLNIDYVTAAMVANAHAAGLKVYVWTHTGTGAELQSLIDMGVDGVYTDNTRVARQYVDSVDGFTTLYGSTAGGMTSGTDANDVIYALQGNDTLLGGGGNDQLNGDGGNDILVAGAGDNLLRGGAGNDVLFGGTGKDILIGGAGNDALVANGGDTIHYAAGDGIDLVTATGTDALVLDDIASTAVTVQSQGQNLVIRFADGGAMVFENGHMPASIAFADGVTLTGAALAALASGTADSAIASAVTGIAATRAAAESAQGLEPAPNLIQNGSFENIDGTLVRDWGRYEPNGLMPGWVNLASGRVEQHQDTVAGVSASDGAYWSDLDGNLNHVQLAQTVEGVETGATYRLSFQIADTDLKDAEKLTVSYGGQVIWQGAPKAAAWETISVTVVGGSGNGSDTLVFAESGGTLNGAGLALDNVAMVKTIDAPAGADDGNLIVNGSFENINGTEYRDWGRYDPAGDMVGWHNLATGRVEQHRDTVAGVSAVDGQYWSDLDGNLNHVQLAQDVKGVQAGATYALTFHIADTDLKDSESLTVTYGGKTVWQGAPAGAAWETITVDLLGGAGDGSDRLVFAESGGTLNGAGLALDDVSMIKTADPYVQHFDLAGAQTWSTGTPYAGFNATFSYTLTDHDVIGASARAWEISLGYDGGEITSAWMSGYNAGVALRTNAAGETVLTTDGMGYQRSLQAGDTLTFTVQGKGADFAAEDARLAFADIDTVPTAENAHGLAIDAAATNDWGSGLGQSVTLLNQGGEGIDNWRVELDLPAGLDLTITSIWGATVTRQADGDLLFTALDYNAAIAAGGTASFGFNASHAAGLPVSFADSQFSLPPGSDLWG
jgi:glycerophosphoryl diester phosphodiesterase